MSVLHRPPHKVSHLPDGQEGAARRGVAGSANHAPDRGQGHVTQQGLGPPTDQQCLNG
jgi:hypothetical protein